MLKVGCTWVPNSSSAKSTTARQRPPWSSTGHCTCAWTLTDERLTGTTSPAVSTFYHQPSRRLRQRLPRALLWGIMSPFTAIDLGIVNWSYGTHACTYLKYLKYRLVFIRGQQFRLVKQKLFQRKHSIMKENNHWRNWDCKQSSQFQVLISTYLDFSR